MKEADGRGKKEEVMEEVWYLRYISQVDCTGESTHV